MPLRSSSSSHASFSTHLPLHLSSAPPPTLPSSPSPPPPPPIQPLLQLYVRSPTSNKSLVLHVPLTATVHDLKAAVALKLGQPLSSQACQDLSLTFSTKPLSLDRRPLSFYGVRDGSELRCTGKLRGGIELVFLFIIFVFSTAFGVPIFGWIYRTWIAKFIESVGEQAAAARMRATERVSEAGRRVTSNRVSGRFK